MISYVALAVPVAAGLLAALAVAAVAAAAAAADADAADAAGLPARPPAAPSGAPPGPAAMSASALSAGGSPVLGDPSAPLTMLEWGDYQCTYCYRFHQETLGEIKAAYVDTGRMRIVFKDFPLNGPDSALAAEASHCAADQGLYWAYHDALYDNWGGERTGWITRASLEDLAAGAGLDAGMLAGCLDEGTHRAKVAELERHGRAIGVDATPSFFIFDGERAVKIRGNLPLGAFEDAIGMLDAPAS